jgi:helicase MOV-10
MYAPSRALSQLPNDLRPYVYTHDKHFSVPGLDKLGTYRIVVSTCVSGSMLSGVGIPLGHYTHIFVDEAGQATEPEVMVPIATLAGDSTNVVLSGDPKQLGPIIRSSVARVLGLEKSYLERIMEREGYNEDTGPHESYVHLPPLLFRHANYFSGFSRVVKLVQNFRSHPSILSYPSEKFYKSELIPCGDPAVTHSFIGSSHLANRDFPIVFYAISGKDEREASSPSFFNIDEVTQVRTIVEDLHEDLKERLSEAFLLPLWRAASDRFLV